MKQEIKFTPDQTLLKFAEWFSSNYKKLPAGHYHSDPLGYSVRYLNRILGDNGRALPTLSRISNRTGVIDIDRAEFMKNKKLTGDFIFHSIIWCVIKKKLQFDWGVESIFEADRMAIEYYTETQPHRSKKDIAIGWLVQMGRSVDTSNIQDRYNAIKKQLLKAQSEEVKLKVTKLKSKKKKPLNNEIKSRAVKANGRKGNSKRKG